MDDHERVEGLELGHVLFHLVRVQVRELVHAGVQQEALEAEDALVVQRAQVGLVARDGAAPEPDIDERLVLGHLALELEVLHRGGGRDGVQRHVDDGGHAAGRGGPGGGGEAFPFGAARLVDVDVGVHQARDEDLVVGELDQLRRPARLLPRGSRATIFPPRTPTSRAAIPAVGQHPPAPDHQVKGRALGACGRRARLLSVLIYGPWGALAVAQAKAVSAGSLYSRPM